MATGVPRSRNAETSKSQMNPAGDGSRKQNRSAPPQVRAWSPQPRLEGPWAPSKFRSCSSLPELVTLGRNFCEENPQGTEKEGGNGERRTGRQPGRRTELGRSGPEPPDSFGKFHKNPS